MLEGSYLQYSNSSRIYIHNGLGYDIVYINQSIERSRSDKEGPIMTWEEYKDFKQKSKKKKGNAPKKANSSGKSLAEELKELVQTQSKFLSFPFGHVEADLKAQGILTQEQFEQAKNKVIAKH